MSRPRTPPAIGPLVRDLKGRLWEVERPAGTWAPATKGLSAKELNRLADGFPGADIPRDETGTLWATSVQGGPRATVVPGFGAALGYADTGPRPGVPLVVIPDEEWPGPWERANPPVALVLPREGYYAVSAGVTARPAPGESTIPYVRLLLKVVETGREIPYGRTWESDVYDPHPPDVTRADLELHRVALLLPPRTRLALMAATPPGSPPVEVTLEWYDVAYTGPGEVGFGGG